MVLGIRSISQGVMEDKVCKMEIIGLLMGFDLGLVGEDKGRSDFKIGSARRGQPGGPRGGGSFRVGIHLGTAHDVNTFLCGEVLPTTMVRLNE